ncbi:hypothetical protein LMG27177_05884 [Paraburkholderia fynbosensis]|uniref:Outer membrane protein W n=1 Tax=Paraburkholderia fynbosensis TaxID=1200993 RepID=A0A6J5GV75_9BURK|nr:hypothetical protein LMG27177_05884 [Paraburkholderia fynbosensis]
MTYTRKWLGVSYNWFSDIQLSDNFVKSTQYNLGAVLAAGASKRGRRRCRRRRPRHGAGVAGLAHNITDHWGLVASATYIPLKTTSPVIIKAADGTALKVSKADLKADPVISLLAVSYRV